MKSLVLKGEHMPAIAKTSDLDVINAARQIIASTGIDGLSMSAIGDAVGIKAPSLYKRFADRQAIVRAVQLTEFAELAKKIDAEISGVDPPEAIRAIARVYWTLAQESPKVYEILFSTNSLTDPDDVAVRTSALLPLFSVSKQLLGPGKALAAARTFTSYIHGFITVQMSGAFDQGPGIEGSFYFGLNAIIKGVGAGD